MKLLDIKKHVISGCPLIYMIKILLQQVTIRHIMNFCINPCIISKTDKVRFRYIFVNISNHTVLCVFRELRPVSIIVVGDRESCYVTDNSNIVYDHICMVVGFRHGELLRHTLQLTTIYAWLQVSDSGSCHVTYYSLRQYMHGCRFQTVGAVTSHIIADDNICMVVGFRQWELLRHTLQLTTIYVWLLVSDSGSCYVTDYSLRQYMHGCWFQTGETVTSPIIAYDNICMVVGFKQGELLRHILQLTTIYAWLQVSDRGNCYVTYYSLLPYMYGCWFQTGGAVTSQIIAYDNICMVVGFRQGELLRHTLQLTTIYAWLLVSDRGSCYVTDYSLRQYMHGCRFQTGKLLRHTLQLTTIYAWLLVSDSGSCYVTHYSLRQYMYGCWFQTVGAVTSQIIAYDNICMVVGFRQGKLSRHPLQLTTIYVWLLVSNRGSCYVTNYSLRQYMHGCWFQTGGAVTSHIIAYYHICMVVGFRQWELLRHTLQLTTIYVWLLVSDSGSCHVTHYSLRQYMHGCRFQTVGAVTSQIIAYDNICMVVGFRQGELLRHTLQLTTIYVWLQVSDRGNCYVTYYSLLPYMYGCWFQTGGAVTSQIIAYDNICMVVGFRQGELLRHTLQLTTIYAWLQVSDRGNCYVTYYSLRQYMHGCWFQTVGAVTSHIIAYDNICMVVGFRQGELLRHTLQLTTIYAWLLVSDRGSCYVTDYSLRQYMHGCRFQTGKLLRHTLQLTTIYAWLLVSDSGSCYVTHYSLRQYMHGCRFQTVGAVTSHIIAYDNICMVVGFRQGELLRHTLQLTTIYVWLLVSDSGSCYVTHYSLRQYMHGCWFQTGGAVTSHIIAYDNICMVVGFRQWELLRHTLQLTTIYAWLQVSDSGSCHVTYYSIRQYMHGCWFQTGGAVTSHIIAYDNICMVVGFRQWELLRHTLQLTTIYVWLQVSDRGSCYVTHYSLRQYMYGCWFQTVGAVTSHIISYDNICMVVGFRQWELSRHPLQLTTIYVWLLVSDRGSCYVTDYSLRQYMHGCWFQTGGAVTSQIIAYDNICMVVGFRQGKLLRHILQLTTIYVWLLVSDRGSCYVTDYSLRQYMHGCWFQTGGAVTSHTIAYDHICMVVGFRQGEMLRHILQLTTIYAWLQVSDSGSCHVTYYTLRQYMHGCRFHTGGAVTSPIIAYDNICMVVGFRQGELLRHILQITTIYAWLQVSDRGSCYVTHYSLRQYMYGCWFQTVGAVTSHIIAYDNICMVVGFRQGELLRHILQITTIYAWLQVSDRGSCYVTYYSLRQYMHGCWFQTGGAVTSHIIAYDHICMVVGFRQGELLRHILQLTTIYAWLLVSDRGSCYVTHYSLRPYMHGCWFHTGGAVTSHIIAYDNICMVVGFRQWELLRHILQLTTIYVWLLVSDRGSCYVTYYSLRQYMHGCWFHTGGAVTSHIIAYDNICMVVGFRQWELLRHILQLTTVYAWLQVSDRGSCYVTYYSLRQYMHGCGFQTGEAVTSHIIAYDNICMVVGFRQGNCYVTDYRLRRYMYGCRFQTVWGAVSTLIGRTDVPTVLYIVPR